jgi:hypothetical protein
MHAANKSFVQQKEIRVIQQCHWLFSEPLKCQTVTEPATNSGTAPLGQRETKKSNSVSSGRPRGHIIYSVIW